MCGINLIIDKKKKLSPTNIERMSDITQHRGPDESRKLVVHSKKHFYYLAANRLKITDQSEAAAQPFVSKDHRHVLLFNGEIYNFHELKNELLQLGIVFSSHSDTEVLFHWIQKYGEAGIEKLQGMFAFIYLDANRDEVTLGRDRFGIKPLYFFEDDHCLIASSEIQPILSTGLVNKKIDDEQVHHYLAYKYAKSPKTFYKSIFELEQGTTMCIANSKREIHQFSKPENNFNGSLEVERIESLLTDSLLQQIDARVPVGLLLSGGVDSTLLLALAHKEGFQMPTFSIVNTKADQSFGTQDFAYSKKAAAQYGAIHHELEVDISMLDQFEDFIANLDQPIGDSAYLMTSSICKYASPSMRVLLSGAGADELFGGYNRHRAFYHYLKYKKTYGYIAPILGSAISRLPVGMPFPYRKKIKLIAKLFESIDSNNERTFHNFLTFKDFSLPIEYSDDQTSKKMEWALQHDQNNYLVQDVLALSDKASMLHGVEIRVPYLSEKLMDYLAEIPAEDLLKKGGKWPLKSILKKYGGQKYVNRQKEGLGLPLSNWLLDKKANRLWELFESEDRLIFQYLNKHLLDKLLDEQRRKAEDHGPLLWSILVLAHWLEQHAK